MILIGNKLEKLKESRGLTQKQLGEILGVSAPAVSAYENNTRRPSYEVLVGYVRIFRVSADFILDTEHWDVVPLSHLNHEHRTFINELAEFLLSREQQSKY